jgi:uncharacterized protein YcgI (DUF1989 family)
VRQNRQMLRQVAIRPAIWAISPDGINLRKSGHGAREAGHQSVKQFPLAVGQCYGIERRRCYSVVKLFSATWALGIWHVDNAPISC